MKKFNEKQIGVTVLSIIALVIAFWAGHFVGERSPYAGFAGAPGVDTTAVSAAQFAPFWKVWHLLDEKYVAATTTTADQKIYGAIEGLASSEGDPYTVFFPPVQNQQFQTDIAGDFEGVGMEIDIKNSQLVVIAPLKDSPSEAAGMKTGDVILKINGTSTTNMTVDQAVSLIRGPKGTKVTLNVLRQDASSTVAAAPFDVVITRNVINIPTLDTSIKGTGGNKIFVISLYSFTADSPDLFRNAIRSFIQSGSNKLILDLRGNPGGYLEAAWDMASYFLPVGDLVVTEDYGTKSAPTIYTSKGYNVFQGKNLKMEILVDGGTASAAEILSGALSQHGIASLVGVKTFGKGSVQELIPITDTTSLKVTVARWLTPDGTNLSHNGLVPQYVVPESDADAAAHIDDQMSKAIQLLNAQ